MSGQRYEHGSTKAAAEPAHRNLAAYELDGDPDIVMKAFTARVASGQLAISDALDMGSVSMAVWQSHGDRRES